MSAINSTHLYNELAYNFDIMEKAIAEGHAKDIDIGFIEIFANDLQELSKITFDKSKIHGLTTRLNVAADRICEATSSVFSDVDPRSQRPLVGIKQPVSVLAKELNEGLTKTGLERLDPFFTMRRIAGEGHCLFRAVAVGVLDYLEKVPNPLKDEFLTKLREQVARFEDESLTALYEDIQLVGQLPKEEAFKASDRLVAFLRQLACCYNRNSKNEVLQGLISEDYLQEMSSMQKCQHGGEPELVALQNVLGLDLRVVDTAVIAKGEQTAKSYLEAKKEETVFLLLSPIHYDILYDKSTL